MKTLAKRGVVLRSRLLPRDHQKGQALVEWMVVAALAMMAVVWAAGEFAQKAEQAAVDGYAYWLQAVAGAIEEVMKQDDAGSHPGAGLLGELPVNQLVPLEPWLVRLKQGGWLSPALASQPKMPYDIRIARLDARRTCGGDRCPLTVLLLGVARSDRQVPHPGAMLAALDGQGLAVTDLAPDRLQGATYQLSNPIAQGVRLPVGTVGILAWRADRASPYVRLNETRRVALAGGVQLGRLAHTGGGCAPDGLVMVGPDGNLRICRSGNWDEVSDRHDHVRACLPRPKRDELAVALMKLSGWWGVFGREPQCECPAGFAPFSPGSGGARVGAVELFDGRACLRL